MIFMANCEKCGNECEKDELEKLDDMMVCAECYEDALDEAGMEGE